MSIRSFTRIVFLVGAFAALGCAGTSTLPPVTQAADAQTLTYASPIAFSSRAAACDYAVKRVRKKLSRSCTLSALSVDRGQCDCTRSGARHGCEIEAAFSCQ